MRINSQEAIAFQTNRSRLNATQMETSLQKLGSGVKVAKGSDNASGLAISETMRGQIRGLSQAQRNMTDGLSVLESINEGMTNVNELLQRARELAVMNASDTLTDDDRKSSEQELTQLFDSVNDSASFMEFNTIKILGEDTSLVLQVGANPGQKMSIDLVDISTTALGLADATLTTREQAEQLITTLDNAIHTVTGHLTKVGSFMQAIEHHLVNGTVFENNLTKSLSLIEDTDMAKEMMNFISLDIRQKGDHLLVSHINKNHQDMLSLFSK